MRMHYITKAGKIETIELSENPLTIGRSADADVFIADEKASRMHCGIRYWDGEFFIKDLKSKNGTFVNDISVDIHQLRPGDKVQVGATVFLFEHELTPGADTALLAVEDAFKGGKGYGTILREIVGETHSAGPPIESAFDAVTAVRAPDSMEPDRAADPSDPETQRTGNRPASANRETMVLDPNQATGARGIVLKRRPLRMRRRKPKSESD